MATASLIGGGDGLAISDQVFVALATGDEATDCQGGLDRQLEPGGYLPGGRRPAPCRKSSVINSPGFLHY